jgi:hypothetical protein
VLPVFSFLVFVGVAPDCSTHRRPAPPNTLQEIHFEDRGRRAQRQKVEFTYIDLVEPVF